jgi:hypothetical protein
MRLPKTFWMAKTITKADWYLFVSLLAAIAVGVWFDFILGVFYGVR